MLVGKNTTDKNVITISYLPQKLISNIWTISFHADRNTNLENDDGLVELMKNK